MITAICGNERNAGRTTVAINLAAMLAQCGKDVLLIDASENQSAMTLYAIRRRWKPDVGYLCISAKGKLELTLAIERYAPRFGEVIVDTDRQTAAIVAARAEKCVIVTSPGWDAEKLDRDFISAASVERPELPVVIVSNRCYPRCKLKTRGLQREPEGTFAWARTAKLSASWAFGYQEGLAATEFEPGSRGSVKETTVLFEALYGKFKPKPLEVRREGHWPQSEVHVFAIDDRSATPAPVANTAGAENGTTQASSINRVEWKAA